jgi:GDP/UDP-N,N'-diacetylbacillosamine 2-epimerase (hydrolysing)
MSKNKRKILIITERRADYSRFKPILDVIKKSKDLEYELIVTGSHLLKKHGYTINEIKKDNFKIHYQIKNFSNTLKINGGESMIVGIGKILISISKIIKKSKPHVILTGFDIGGNFALTIAGAHLNIPVVHIQGGEVTGSIDESLRHSMSKFSNYHLVANADAKKRLVKMGELEKNIYVVGCPSLDALFSAKKINHELILEKFNINLKKNFAIIIQHPVTSEDNYSGKQIIETIKAVKKIGIQSLFVLPNNDSGHDKIIKIIRKSKIKWTENLSLSEYSALLSHAKILIGNSSSGIHEAASFNLAVVNIGTRQNGRLKPRNVVNADYACSDIYKKIKFCIYNKKFIRSLKSLKNPYGDGKSSIKIANILRKIDISRSTQKQNTY